MTGKYSDVTIEGIDFKLGEPWFLIRGQDRLAPDAIRAYRDLLQSSRGGIVDSGMNRLIHEVDVWQKAHQRFVKDLD